MRPVGKKKMMRKKEAKERAESALHLQEGPSTNPMTEARLLQKSLGVGAFRSLASLKAATSYQSVCTNEVQ